MELYVINMKTIALDYDSVIAKVIPPILTILNRRMGSHLTINDIKEYPYAFERLGLKSEFFKALSEVHKSDMLEFTDEHAFDVLHRLRQYGEIYVLTGNREENLEPIRKFLKDYGLPFEVLSSCGERKSIWKWDILVDDDPRAGDLIHESRHVITFDQPWNQHIKARHRAKDWLEVEAIIKALV